MSAQPRSRALLALSVALASAPLYAAEPTPAKAGDANLEEMIIVATRENRVSKGATGLTLDVKETPQSISVVDQELIRSFSANTLNDALRLATGIQVEEWETNRTNYLSRGFEIKSTQIDGVGLPNDWGIVTGAMDAFGYEKLEVIRGANGLLTGVGNASGTINYIRKRPTNTAEGSIEVTAGSQDLARLEADYSTPLTEDGAWAGRVVVATEDKESHVRDMANDRTFVYGVIDGQLGERSTLTAGYTYQVAHTDGNMWGALVLVYDDGTQAEFERDASTSQNWSEWDTVNQTAFIEYTYALPQDWQLKLSYNHRRYEDENKLFFAYTVTGLDRDDKTGLIGWPGNWPTEERSHLFDATVNGDYSLFGREHELILGGSHSRGKNTQYVHPADPSEPAFGLLPAFPYDGNAIPEPVWGAKMRDGVTNSELSRLYAATRISLHDRVNVVLGVNAIEFERDGDAGGVPFDQTERETSPYAGVTVEITEDLLAYASYSDIYQPQDQKDINEEYLAPTKGVNYEVGLKSEWFDKHLLATVALFSAEQQGLATFAGWNPTSGQYYYTGMDVKSEGLELELTGQVNEHLRVVLGYTTLEMEDGDGEDTYAWVPRNTVNLSVIGTMPFNTDISVGMNGKWQSATAKVEEYTGILVRQDDYMTLNSFARWQVTDRLHIGVNLNNLTDEKYLTSLYQVGYYAAPRNGSISIGYSL